MSFLNNLPFNWFDLAVIGILVFGISRGRKRGMSEELMPLLKWVLLVAGCAFAYEPISQMISSSSQAITPFWANVTAYLGTALVIAIGFAAVTKLMGGKLVGSDVFGSNEYYLGMVAGALRFCCGLILVLALLNARLYRTYEVRQQEQYQKDMYGSTFFPTPQTIQAQIFERSLIGPTIKNQLGFLLIKPTVPESRPLKRKQIDLP